MGVAVCREFVESPPGESAPCFKKRSTGRCEKKPFFIAFNREEIAREGPKNVLFVRERLNSATDHTQTVAKNLHTKAQTPNPRGGRQRRTKFSIASSLENKASGQAGLLIFYPPR